MGTLLRQRLSCREVEPALDFTNGDEASATYASDGERGQDLSEEERSRDPEGERGLVRTQRKSDHRIAALVRRGGRR